MSTIKPSRKYSPIHSTADASVNDNGAQLHQRQRRVSLPASEFSDDEDNYSSPWLHDSESAPLAGAEFTTAESSTVTAAHAASHLERQMSLWTGLQRYPKAIAFSLGLSLAVVMEGYDTWLLGSFWSLPAFARQYGQPTGVLGDDGTMQYEVRAQWQTALSVATASSQILGLFLNGIVSERIGYRRMMMFSLGAISMFIFVTFFAVNIKMLLVGYVLSGLPWGIFQTLTVTYAAEVMPVNLRPYLTTYVNLCWVMGQLIGSGVLKAFVNNDTQWAFRVPYAIQWVWPGPIFIICLIAPESPWWLVRHGRLDEARKALQTLTSRAESDTIEDTLAMMIHTNELEMHQSTGTSYRDCFQGVDLRRTELTVMTWLVQQTSGSPMIGWGTYFMTQVGLSKSDAYTLGIAQNCMGFIGTVGSWFLMPHYGRRELYLWGQIVMFAGLVLIGGLGIPTLSSSTGWATGVLMLLLTFVYDFTVGPVCYALVAELPSTRLRVKSVVLSRNMYNVAGLFIGALQPHFMNPTSWNWGGKTAFLWAAVNLCGLLWTYYRLPEPKGLTYADLDLLFEHEVPARQFGVLRVDALRRDPATRPLDCKEEDYDDS